MSLREILGDELKGTRYPDHMDYSTLSYREPFTDREIIPKKHQWPHIPNFACSTCGVVSFLEVS